jgi:predicted transcriptional regulator
MDAQSDRLVFVSAAVPPALKTKLAQLAQATDRSQASVIRILLDGATPRDLERRTERAEGRMGDAK